MITVIIAGGSGTRLWPLSTSDYPKHLLKLTSEKSMLQQAYGRASRLEGDIFVITEQSHSDVVFDQLPDLARENIIVEPGRRGTASCVVAALAKIAKSGADKNEPIIFVTADHHVNDVDGYVNTVRFAGKTSAELGRLTTLGVEPDHPATGFGYIKKSRPINQNGYSFVYEVESFHEKPNLETAQDYIESGQYLWNMGYFVANYNTFERVMKEFAPYLHECLNELLSAANDAEFNAKYLDFVNEQIDTALAEKVKDLLVVPGSFDWMDVGSFKDLYEATRHDPGGNFTKGYVEAIDIENSFIRNDEVDKPVAVIGLDNVVVVNTPHGILVARKDLSQRVGDVAKKIAKDQATK